MKRGFNLIELAIVLTIVGLAIGGIYTAAAALYARHNYETFSKDTQTLITNARNFFNGTEIENMPNQFLTGDQIEQFGLSNGTTLQNRLGVNWGVYNNLYTVSSLGYGTLKTIGIWTMGIPASACALFLVEYLGTPTKVQNERLWMLSVNNVSTPFAAGFTPDLATAVCGTDSASLVITVRW